MLTSDNIKKIQESKAILGEILEVLRASQNIKCDMFAKLQLSTACVALDNILNDYGVINKNET
jgi:hypothetical protein